MHSSPGVPLHGTVDAPPSKSVTHRAILLSALGEGVSVIRNPLLSGDTLSTLAAATLMGAGFTRGKALTVRPSLHQASDVINANNSGTTARLFSSVCALLPGYAVITGDASLKSRPMGPIISAVRQLGGKAFSTSGQSLLPAVFGGRMHRAHATLRGDISSQFASSLAISCPLKEEDTEIRLTGRMQSPAYLRLTLEMAELFGCRTELDGSTLYCTGGSGYTGRSITVPGDFSSASFMLAAGAVTGGEVEVRGLDTRLTQADARISEVLELFGCTVSRRSHGIAVLPSSLHGADVDCTPSPDLFPVTCAVAAASRGRSTVRGSSGLRYKETDRIQTTLSMLRRMGVRCSVDAETITVEGGKVRGGYVDVGGDHRIVMAACVAGLASAKGCTISNGESHAVSYPSFVSDLRALGGRVRMS